MIFTPTSKPRSPNKPSSTFQKVTTTFSRALAFEWNVSVTGNWFRIHFLQARPQGQRYGDTLVSVLLSYCRKSGLVPLAVDPEQYENFWRRNDFEPTPDDDQLWVHEEWSEAYSGEFV